MRDPAGLATPGGVVRGTVTDITAGWEDSACRDVANAFDGVPRTTEILFFAMAYELSGTVVTPRPDTGASYGAGQLRIYQALTTRTKPVPFARSNAAGNYPGRPVAEVAGEPGQSPGAPLPWPSQEESSRRMVVHELGHGLQEAAQGGTNRCSRPIRRCSRTTSGRWAGSRVGPQEDFAEAVMAYVRAPDTLRARSPRRYEFIRDRRQRWTPGSYPSAGPATTRCRPAPPEPPDRCRRT